MIIPQIPWIRWFHDISSPFLWDTYMGYFYWISSPKIPWIFPRWRRFSVKGPSSQIPPRPLANSHGAKKMWRNCGFIHVYIILYIPRKAWDIDGIKIEYLTNKWQDNTMARYSLSVTRAKSGLWPQKGMFHMNKHGGV